MTHSRLENTIYGVVSMKFSYLQITITSNTLWIQKVWVLGKFARLKNCQGAIFRLIIIRIKLIKLLMSCHNTLSKMLKKKPFLSQKYQDFSLIAIFVNSSFGIEYFEDENRHFFSLVPNLYLWNSRLTTSASVLKYYLRQASPQKSLYYEY